MLYDWFQALQKPLGVFLIYQIPSTARFTWASLRDSVAQFSDDAKVLG